MNQLSKSSLAYITSSDGEKWSKPSEVSSAASQNGASLTVFKNKVYGVYTSSSDNQPNSLYAGSYSKKSGFNFELVGKKYKAESRSSIAVLEDRLYILYRGTDNGIYLIYSEDGSDWQDLGRIGSKYAETHQSPAIHPLGKKLLLAGVGADKLTYYTITDKDGKRDLSWTKIPSRAPENAGGLALAPRYGDEGDPDIALRLFRNVNERNTYVYQVFVTGTDFDQEPFSTWGDVQLGAYARGGVAVTPYKDRSIFVTFINPIGHLTSHVINEYDDKSRLNLIDSNLSMFSELGVVYHDGELILSYAARAKTNNVDESSYRETSYTTPAVMDEKKALAEAGSQWDCKWQEDDDKKTDIKSMVRGCFCL